jgi:hypothetical protein
MTSVTSSPLSFAEQYRLRITRDAYGTRIIAGRVGSLITEYGDGRLTVLLMGTRAKWWSNRRRALIAAGAHLEQDGDIEGSLSFDPANVTACAPAIKAAGCKRRRKAVEPSDSQLAARAAFAERARTNGDTTRNARAVPKTDDRAPGLPCGALRVFRHARTHAATE